MHRTPRGTVRQFGSRPPVISLHRSRQYILTRAAAEKFEAQVAVVLGTQWGDEGKGKLVDILAQQYDIVARAQVRSSSTKGLVTCRSPI